jgi:hypothetical protein
VPSCGAPKSDSSTYDGYATRPRKGASLRGPGMAGVKPKLEQQQTGVNNRFSLDRAIAAFAAKIR